MHGANNMAAAMAVDILFSIGATLEREDVHDARVAAYKAGAAQREREAIERRDAAPRYQAALAKRARRNATRARNAA